MTQLVVDHTSNIPEQIEQAARLLGKPKSHKYRVFEAVYRGQKSKKTVEEVMKATKLPRTRVLDAGKALDSQGLLSARRGGGTTSYHKVKFFTSNRNRVIRYANNPRKLERLATKRRPHGARLVTTAKVEFVARLPATRAKAMRVTIDDLLSFKKVKSIPDGQPYVRVSEREFKKGMAAILGERGTFQDWGGENSDLSSTRLRITSTNRVAAAFAFKGPGKGGKLVPGKMGKNGDQIQRLVLRCPASAFIVQHWRDIDDSVVEQMESYARLKAYVLAEKVWFGTIDGSDSVRIMKAYPEHFPSMARRK